MFDKAAKEQFNEQGYQLVEGLLNTTDFEPVIADYTKVLDDLIKEARTDNGDDVCADDDAQLPFTERYLKVGGAFIQHFTIALPQRNVRADTPIFLAPGVFSLLTHPRILDAVESLIGPEIAVSPVGNVRIKPPEKYIADEDEGNKRGGLFRAAPWHQDNGVVTEDADATPMVTVWFSLTEASVEAGCLQVIPGSHRRELMHHCPNANGELFIPDALLPQQKPVPVPTRVGDVLFLHRKLCHASLPNYSDKVRWSFDLRYIPAGAKSGRELFPTFVARSRAHPESVLNCPRRWAQLWLDTRARLAANEPPPRSWNRWDPNATACA